MKKENVREFYDVVWTEYVPEFDASKEHLELFFDEDEIKGKEILDCGCGTGIFTNIMGTMGAKKVTGLDISPGSLSTGRSLKEKFKLDNVDFQEGEMLQLPYEDDVLTSLFSCESSSATVLHFFDWCQVFSAFGCVRTQREHQTPHPSEERGRYQACCRVASPR